MSKKCLAIAKKAMVWTLAASMLVATPLTASATGLRGVYSVSDGWNDDVTGIGDSSHTGTVTNTDTNSGVMKDHEAKILGIVLDKEHVNVEVDGKRETLKATIILDGLLQDSEGKLSEEFTKEQLKQLESKIKWQVFNYDPDPDKESIDSNTNKILSISPTTTGDRTQVTLNPRKGTKAGEDMVVKAKLDGTYYYDSSKQKWMTVDNVTEGFEAKATVSIKEYAKTLSFATVPGQYETHTVDMNEYLEKGSDTVNETFLWSIESGVKGAATINANTGIVTVKKYSTKSADETKNWFKVTAVSEKGISATTEQIDILQAVKADKVGIYLDNDKTSDPAKPLKKYDLDFGKDETTVDVKAVMFKKEGKEYVIDESITDKVTWTSNKPGIVKVVGAKETDNEEAVTLEAVSAGKAVITAKTSSNKKATLSVTVNATLTELKIVDITDTLYSGQSVTMEVERTPEQNTENLKWSIEKVDSGKTDKKGNAIMIANPNATINNKGVLTIKNTVNNDPKYKIVVRVTSSKTKGTKGNDNVDEKGFIFDTSSEITVDQSNVKSITVTEEGESDPLARVNAEDKKDKVTGGKSELSVPKTKTYRAVTDPDGLEKSLKWTASGNNKIVKLKDNGDGTASITAVGKGTATITVSGVYVNSKNKAAVIKTSFKVNVKQPVKTITLSKSLVVLNEKTKKVRGENVLQNQTVSFKATLGPKGVDTKKETVTWIVNANANKATIDSKGKLTLTQPEVGDEFEVTAKTSTGVYATATVKVTKKTTGVEIWKDETTRYTELNSKNKEVKNTKYMEVGEKITMQPMVNTDSKKAESDWIAAGTDNREEVISYTANKKGIVTIDSYTGEVFAVKKGKVTITAKTASGKTGKLTVEVK